MIDSNGRTIDYLRLSITDRCNLRCLYCMPPEGVDWITHNEVLRFEEILTICRILADMGIRSVKVTGGEPLTRKRTANLVRELKAISGIERVTITSNGVLLGEHLESLAAAGLEAVNISLDTLDEEKFRRLTRSEGFGNILPAIDKALSLGLKLKINCVPMRGFNEGDIVKLAAMAKDRNIAVRFIELIPLGAAAALQPIAANEVISLIEETYGQLTPSYAKLGNGPARYYTLQGFKGYIGFINTMSHSFCSSCNRLRLTASGILKPCLSSSMGLDLRSLVRNSGADLEIEAAIRELVSNKPARHNFGIDNEKQGHLKKEMFRIGG